MLRDFIILLTPQGAVVFWFVVVGIAVLFFRHIFYKRKLLERNKVSRFILYVSCIMFTLGILIGDFGWITAGIFWALVGIIVLGVSRIFELNKNL